MRFWTVERDTKLIAMHGHGAKLREIADAVGLSHVSVSRRIKELRLNEVVPKAPTRHDHIAVFKRARRGFHVPVHLESAYHDLLKAGVPIVEACRRLGIEHAKSKEADNVR